MNFKTTLFLLVLLVAVGMVYYLTREAPSSYDIQLAEKSEQAGAEAMMFPNDEVSSEFVARVEIEHEGKRLVFTKDHGDWFQIEPVHVPLQTWLVRDLIKDVMTLSYHEKFVAGHNGMPTLENVRLAPEPVATVRLFQVNASDKPIIAVGFGRTTTMADPKNITDGDLIYANQLERSDSSDQEIYVIPGNVLGSILLRGADGWRQKTMKTPPVENLNHIKLDDGIAKNTVVHMNKPERQGTDWKFDGALQGRVSSQAIGAFIDHLDGLQVVAFVEDAPTQFGMYGLGSASRLITLDWPKKTITISLGAATDLLRNAFFVGWQENGQPMAVVSISKEDFEKLEVKPEDWRSPDLTPTLIDQIQTISLQSDKPDIGYQLTKQDRTWHFNDPAIGYAPDRESITKLLAALKTTQASSFTSQVEMPDNPLATLTINGNSPDNSPDNQADNQTLLIHNAPNKNSDDRDNLIVTRTGDTVGRVISYAAIEPLLTNAASLRDRTILDLNAASVNRLSIHQAGESQPLVFEHQREDDGTTSNQWRLAGHTRYERDALDELLATLLPLRADSWLKDNHVLGDSRTEVVIDAIDGSQGLLTLDSQTGIAVVEGFTGVFKLSDRTFNAIHAEFRDRTLLAIQPGEIEQLTLRQLAGTLTFEPDKQADPSLSLVSPAEGNVDAERLNAFVNLLGQLRVTRYTSPPPTATTSPGYIELDDARRVDIHLELRDGSKRNLSFWPTAPTRLGLDHDSQRWFLLDEATMQTIELPLIESE